MIESKNDASRNLEKALQALEQAKQRVANEKKKQNEKKRKAENHHKYIMGGIIVKYFPDCYPLVNFAFRQKPKCGFYLPTKSMSAPLYFIGRM